MSDTWRAVSNNIPLPSSYNISHTECLSAECPKYLQVMNVDWQVNQNCLCQSCKNNWNQFSSLLLQSHLAILEFHIFSFIVCSYLVIALVQIASAQKSVVLKSLLIQSKVLWTKIYVKKGYFYYAHFFYFWLKIHRYKLL